MPRTLLPNGGAKASSPCADSRDPRGKEVRQKNSEENGSGYVSTLPCELHVHMNHLGTCRFQVSRSES